MTYKQDIGKMSDTAKESINVIDISEQGEGTVHLATQQASQFVSGSTTGG